jgi:hypothetical protein
MPRRPLATATENDELVPDPRDAAIPERRIADLILDLVPMKQATNLPDLFAGLARSVVNTVRVDACLVSLLDEERNVLRDVAASVVPPAQLNTIAAEYELDDFPATKAAIEAKETVEISVSDAGSDTNERSFLEQ